MAKKHYESVVIINAALEDDQIEQTISRLENAVKSNDGEITDVEKIGRRRLAYPIQKAKSGYYFILRFLAPPDLITKLERVYRLDETVIRYLTIVLSKRDLINIEDNKRKAELEAQEAEKDKAASDDQNKPDSSDEESAVDEK